MIDLRKANDRGVGEHGWLSSRHTFSFAGYDDPAQRGFSDLLVINDDRVDPAEGFGTHPHRDMEILSYVLEGVLAHRDTLGHGSVIRPGDVQLMSAGSGIAHSEFNASPTEAVHFLQIWIQPARRGVRPRYQQTRFPVAEQRGRLRVIAAPDGRDGALVIGQDVVVYAGAFDAGDEATLNLLPDRAAYIHVARGAVRLNGIPMQVGDGAKLTDESRLAFTDGNAAEVLVFDLRGPGTTRSP
ncbi:MAG: pirin family protein [Zoogloeaceae bacterium]|nr:pirin family protein [Zoogloeaceae bacterium]